MVRVGTPADAWLLRCVARWAATRGSATVSGCFGMTVPPPEYAHARSLRRQRERSERSQPRSGSSDRESGSLTAVQVVLHFAHPNRRPHPCDRRPVSPRPPTSQRNGETLTCWSIPAAGGPEPITTSSSARPCLLTATSGLPTAPGQQLTGWLTVSILKPARCATGSVWAARFVNFTRPQPRMSEANCRMRKSGPSCQSPQSRTKPNYSISPAGAPAAQFGRALAAWSLAIEDLEVIERRQVSQRSWKTRVEPDGMVVTTFRQCLF